MIQTMIQIPPLKYPETELTTVILFEAIDTTRSRRVFAVTAMLSPHIHHRVYMYL